MLLYENIRQQKSCKKKYWIETSLFHPIYHIHQTLCQAISIFFFLNKKLWIATKFLRTDENICGKLFELETARFYVRGIPKLPDKLQAVIQNNDKYIVDWNEFIVELFMIEIHFT